MAAFVHRTRVLKKQLEHGGCRWTVTGDLRGSCLMRHGVSDVIEDDTKSQSGELFRVLRAIRPFPGVAKMHVGADRHHDASVAVADGAPLGHVAVLLIG